MIKKKTLWIAALLLAMLLAGGCGPKTNSQQITQFDKTKTTSDSGDADKGEQAEALKEDNELPEDGIITKAQMETISGKDGEYKFHGEDQSAGIAYTWIYEGKKIQNPEEQKMKVRFTEDEIDAVKKAANNAAVGIGITLEEENLSAPPKLIVTLTEKWDADAVILCKLVDGVPKKMADVTIGEGAGKDQQGVTTLTFPVTEVGDTYYLLGGRTQPDDTSENKGEDKKDSKATSDSRDSGREGNSGRDADRQPDSQGAASSDHTCTISIECSTILNNWGDLRKSKADFVPSDGWIYNSSVVAYNEGETVYDVLYRVCKDSGIQMSASYTPMYGSYYVEGINQLYEFDCGELSGWMYSVNGWFPNYGCSKYEVSDNDVIEWRYTCDLGRDVGDQFYG